MDPHQATLKSQIHYEVNDLGTWRPAFCAEAVDANNGVFLFVGEGGGLYPITAPRGTDSGCFRNRGE